MGNWQRSTPAERGVRSKTPLLYKAIPSWFVRVQPVVDQLVENNARTLWYVAWQLYFYRNHAITHLGCRKTLGTTGLPTGSLMLATGISLATDTGERLSRYGLAKILKR